MGDDVPKPKPKLFHFRVSHYNEKVRWALDFKKWEHVRVRLTPGFHILRMRWLTGQPKVPVLVLDGKAIAGSATILAAIEQHRPDPPLFPEDAKDRARALAIQKHFDDEVAPDLRRIFWWCYLPRADYAVRVVTDGSSGLVKAIVRVMFPILRPIFRANVGASAAKVEAAKKRLDGHFARLESEIGKSGYLVGDRFGIADLAAASIMTALVRPPEFTYPLPEPMSPELAELREPLKKRAGFQWVEDIYQRHRGPSCAIESP